jgi:hypothetical protein
LPLLRSGAQDDQPRQRNPLEALSAYARTSGV